eukprot:scaffold13333_cov32-Tisochrysis_lutea.AAC.2
MRHTSPCSRRLRRSARQTKSRAKNSRSAWMVTHDMTVTVNPASSTRMSAVSMRAVPKGGAR